LSGAATRAPSAPDRGRAARRDAGRRLRSSFGRAGEAHEIDGSVGQLPLERGVVGHERDLACGRRHGMVPLASGHGSTAVLRALRLCTRYTDRISAPDNIVTVHVPLAAADCTARTIR